MATTTEHRVTLPEAARLADLIGIKADLEKVVAYTSRMIERWCGEHLATSALDVVGFTTPVDLLEWEALSTATAVAYARCFASGVRGKLPRVEDVLTDPELRATHDFLVDFRNKHAAHPVNTLEENEVAVHINANFGSSSEIDSVTPHHTRQAGFGFDLPARAGRLSEWWLSWLSREIHQERVALLAVLRGTDLHAIRSWPLASRSAAPRAAAAGYRNR